MRRKTSMKSNKNEKSSATERENLLTIDDQHSSKRSKTDSKYKNLSLPSSPTNRRHETTTFSTVTSPSTKPKLCRKKSAWAPVATATTFEDVPVFIICPYCNSKVVTKTQFKKGRKHWCYCCCCLPYFLDVFKDVIHVCPKCNKQIAIYNRFQFFPSRKANVTPNQETQTATNNQSKKPVQITNQSKSTTATTTTILKIPTAAPSIVTTTITTPTYNKYRLQPRI